jgi:dihydrofolate reductase
MGRKTFDTVIGFGVEMWPYGTVPIIVYTKNSQNVHVPHWIHENGYKVILPKSPPSPTTLFEEIQQDETIIPLTKEEEKKSTIKVYIDGGATIQSFMKEGLVHEMTLTTVPILLGDGIPLFPASATATTHTKLKHRSTTAYSNGAVQSSYIIEKE